MSTLRLQTLKSITTEREIDVDDLSNSVVSGVSPYRVLAKGLDKINNGVPVGVAFYGDSIFYGQDGDGSLPPINGATQPRSDTPIPESFQKAMESVGMNFFTVNRTWPGDTTDLGLSRWEGQTGGVDFSFIMYGHNDANDYGGSGGFSVEEYANNMMALIKRELDAGAYPIVVEPPPVLRSQDERIRPYGREAEDVAEQAGVPFVRVVDYLAGEGTFTVDEVHLTKEANRAIGYNLASMFIHRGGVSEISAGFYTPAHNIGTTNGIYVYDNTSDSGRVYELEAGQYIGLVIKLEETLVPRVHCFSTFSVNSLDLISSGEIDVSFKTHKDQSSSKYLSFQGSPLHKGTRFLLLKANDNNTAKIRIEGFSFESTNLPQISAGVVLKSNSLSGVHKPRDGELFEGHFSAVDYYNQLGEDFSAYAHISSDGGTSHGLAFWEDKMTIGSEVISNRGILVFKMGKKLIIRELQSEPFVMTDDDTIDAFPTQEWSGELAVVKSGSSFKVYIDGAEAGGITLSSGFRFKSCYPGVIAVKGNSLFSVNSVMLTGVRKI